jgi:hypothetical protein
MANSPLHGSITILFSKKKKPSGPLAVNSTAESMPKYRVHKGLFGLSNTECNLGLPVCFRKRAAFRIKRTGAYVSGMEIRHKIVNTPDCVI